MFTPSIKFPAASQASLEAQAGACTALAGKAFEGIEKIADLNLKAARAGFEDLTSNVKSLLSASGPQEFYALASAQTQPALEKIVAYNRQLGAIVADLQNDLAKVVEGQLAEASQKVGSLVDEMSKNAPAGSENALNMLKSAMGNAQAGYEQFSKSGKQAAQALGDNLDAVVKEVSKAAANAGYTKH